MQIQAGIKYFKGPKYIRNFCSEVQKFQQNTFIRDHIFGLEELKLGVHFLCDRPSAALAKWPCM